MSETAIFDHYEVLRREDGSLYELGRGAMGITYRAFDTNLRCHVALKVINAASIDSEVARQRFVREARAAAQLRHRHVASVFHLGIEGDVYFYAMEFIDGETVESLIRRGGPLDPVLALQITLQVARALNAAQKHHLIHRDIKPSNLMLVHEDEELVAKVIDFGLAKSSRKDDGDDTASLSVSGFVGTPHFASPEQLEEKEIDVRSDIYSLGVTLWYMLAGEAPFGGSIAQVMSHHLHTMPPVHSLKKVPPALRDLLARMLEKDPAKRPQTPLDLRKEIECCIELLVALQPSLGEMRDVELRPQTPDAQEHKTLRRVFCKGEIVASRYEILEDLGEGNAGWMFHARDRAAQREVRLVVLHSELAENSDALTQVEREVENLQKSPHPNLLAVLGIERVEHFSFFIMEWTNGFTLLDALRARQEIDASEVLTLLQQAAHGIDFALSHGLKRLDLTLNQIAIDFSGQSVTSETAVGAWPQFALKFNALGLTREFATSDTWAGDQTIVGGIAAAAGDSGTTNLAAKYVRSLAALVYELLGGSLPPVMLASEDSQLAPRYVPLAGLPETGNEVLKRALDPARAFASAQDFFLALQSATAGALKKNGGASSAILKPARASHPAPESTGKDFRKHLPLLLFSAIAAVIVVLAAIVFVFFRNSVAPKNTVARPIIGSSQTPAPAASSAPEPLVTPIAAPSLAPENRRQALLKTNLVAAENYESARDWPRAIAAYAKLARDFPESDLGRVRLELILTSLRSSLEKMNDADFARLAHPVTEAAQLDVVPAMMILAAHLRKDQPRDAFNWFCAAAALGHAPALVQVGLMYSNGAGVARDFAKAVEWFERAAEKGDAAGKSCLAECYLYGRGVRKDERRAVEILQDAVAGGDPRAMNLLGTCFHQGIGVAKNYDEAFQLFSQAQALKFDDAVGNVGVLYINGDGVKPDARKAVELFQQGARDGNAYCMFLLARCLEIGTGTEQNGLAAETWYRKSAEAGNPRALEWCRKNNLQITPR